MPSYNLLTAIHFSFIFKHILANVPKKEELKAMLPVIAVCQSWRKAALPDVYRTLCISIYLPLEQLDMYKSSVENERINNKHLILYNNYSHLVKNIHIDTVNISVLKRVFLYDDLFNKNSNIWLSVTSVSMEVKYGMVIDDCNNPLPDLLQFLKANLPNIQRLKLVDCYKYKENEVYDYFVDAYASNLRSLHVDADLACHNNIAINNIAALSIIPYANTQALLARIDLNGLRHLKLYEIPLSFKWNILACHDDDTCITFRNLESLQLVYRKAYSTRNRNVDKDSIKAVEIRYPRLKTLTFIKHSSATDDRYVKHVFPPNMESITAKEAPSFVNWLLCLNIVNCQSLLFNNCYESNVYYPTYDTQDHADSLNRVFATSGMFKSVAIQSNIPRVSIKSKHLDWQNLQCLKMLNEIAFENLVAFIKKLPELKALNATHVCFQNRHRFVANARNKRMQQHLKPFNSKLVRLSIICANHEYNADYNAWCIDRLLLRLVRLKQFISDKDVFDGLSGFHESFKTEYPHIENLELFSAAYHTNRNSYCF